MNMLVMPPLLLQTCMQIHFISQVGFKRGVQLSLMFARTAASVYANERDFLLLLGVDFVWLVFTLLLLQ